MCLAIPGKITEIIENPPALRIAKVSFSGVIKDICIEWLPEVKINDYVLAHAGTALTIVDPEEARLTLETFRQWAESLEDEDLK